MHYAVFLSCIRQIEISTKDKILNLRQDNNQKTATLTVNRINNANELLVGWFSRNQYLT